MKKGGKIALALVFATSLGLNIWHFSVRRPLSPAMGTGVNADYQQTEDGGGQSSFRIATFNIHRCKGLDDVKSCQRIADAIKGLDIVALNEVGGGNLLFPSNQAEELGKLLETGWLFLPNQERYFSEHFGNGLLTSLEVTRWFREQLVHNRERSRSHRNLTTIALQFDGRPMQVLVTHLDRGDIRSDQLHYVLEKFGQCQHCILLGDFNTQRTDPRLDRLLQDQRVTDAIGAALGAEDPPRIDWIFTKGFRVVDGGWVPLGISDHPMFWVELAFE
jgi:endonuclease/exonuclease/phosphatase family metal-dependent hydrolase